MRIIDVIATLAVLQYLVFGALVGRARGLYGVKAPAVTGHEQFERIYRVQMNTLELLVALLPALYLAARYWPSWVVGIAGGLYLIGRVIYWRAYVAAPHRRGLGFALSLYPILLLLLAALAGAAMGSGAA